MFIGSRRAILIGVIVAIVAFIVLFPVIPDLLKGGSELKDVTIGIQNVTIDKSSIVNESIPLKVTFRIVNQGDKVTLHFIGVQGAHHMITLDGIETFPLSRGQIHTISFIANSSGTINYTCHLHMPNMVGQILVLPKSI